MGRPAYIAWGGKRKVLLAKDRPAGKGEAALRGAPLPFLSGRSCARRAPAGCILLFRVAQLREDVEVLERGGVALDLCAGGHLLEQTAHDFA